MSLDKPYMKAIAGGYAGTDRPAAETFLQRLQRLRMVLMDSLRRIGLAGSELCRARAGMLRLKFVNMRAVIVRSTRRVRFLLSKACPLQGLVAQILNRVNILALSKCEFQGANATICNL